MAIELKLQKTDNSPWGFRLTGGADCDVPHTVVKIVEGSIADVSGLTIGDVIVRINEHSVADRTHLEVHDIISEADKDLIFAVRRDYYSYDDEEDENNNLEVSNILNANFDQQTHNENVTESNVHYDHNSPVSRATDELIAEAISGEAEVLPDQNILGVNFNKIDLSQSTILTVMEAHKSEEAQELSERKWSSFLQKPQRPVMKPKPKHTEDSKAPPYQVVIKKQKKKHLEVDIKAFSPDPEPEQDDNQECLESIMDQDEEAADPSNDENAEDCFNQTNADEEDEHERENDESDDGNLSELEDNNELTDNNVKTEKVEETQLSVDQQLAQIQMQLKALAEMPSSIQETLESVTKQLTNILNATQLRTEEEQDLDSVNVSRGDSVERSLDELEEEEKEREHCTDEKDSLEAEEEYKSNASEASERGNFDSSQEEEIPFSKEDEFVEPEISEEELERLRIENEKSVQKERNVLEESHQRRLEQRPTNPLAPVQRPIILPGGRKWAQPDDAVPVRRKKSSMSDEKIIETLDTYSETIVGHTKGINFLKYQPPAKNLDYLQKSEVYKLIHDMDEPPRGIATRPEIVPSEQDYYTKRQ